MVQLDDTFHMHITSQMADTTDAELLYPSFSDCSALIEVVCDLALTLQTTTRQLKAAALHTEMMLNDAIFMNLARGRRH